MQRLNRKWVIGLLIVIVAIITGIFHQLDTPPVKEITEVRGNITIAEKLHAEKYADTFFSNARASYDSAMVRWKEENEKMFLFRDYQKVRVLAVEANRQALSSIELSKVSVSNMRSLVAGKIDDLKMEANRYNLLYGKVPLTEVQLNAMAEAKFLLEEGVQAFENKNYGLAQQKLSKVDGFIDPITSSSKDILEKYFESYPKWQEWVARAINDSYKQSTWCIIVDKYARKCQVYKSGSIKYSYDIELGPNWIGDKNHHGDKSTPEGLYKIVKMKFGHDTKYYKALLLDYPNEEDKKRFAFNKKKGRIPEDTAIGGLIEIHGNGGNGLDWTEGCIALTDTSMDALFAVCGVDTQVIIVGSLVPLNELMHIDEE